MKKIELYRDEELGLKSHFETIDAQWKCVEALPKYDDLPSAKKVLATVAEASDTIAYELRWIETNKKGRDDAVAIEKSIVKNLEPLLKRYDVPNMATALYDAGVQLRKDSKALLESGQFAEAGEKFAQAKSKLEDAIAEARSYHVRTALASSKEFQKAGLFEKALKEAERAASFGPKSLEASNLKADIQVKINELVRVAREKKEAEERKQREAEARCLVEKKVAIKKTIGSVETERPQGAESKRVESSEEAKMEKGTESNSASMKNSSSGGGGFFGWNLFGSDSRRDAYHELVNEGFVSLFNGVDLSGWSGSSCFAVEKISRKFSNGRVNCESVIVFSTDRRQRNDSGNLVTMKRYGNFILRFEFMVSENANGGIGIRVPNEASDIAHKGMCELKLLDDGGSSFYDASGRQDRLKSHQYTGSVSGIVPSRRDNVNKQIWGKDKNFAGGGSYSRRPGMWNFVEVKVIGSEIEEYLNGYLVLKADLAKYRGDGDTLDGMKHPGLHNKLGYITLCGHEGFVRWKNVRIKELASNIKMNEFVASIKETCPLGFTAYFDGDPSQLKEMWNGVTTEEKFDNPNVRQRASPAKRAEMLRKANAARDAHWSVRNGSLFFDGFKGGYSLATVRDLEDFELWVDWRLMSVTGDSGLYLRGSPQIQIWDAHNQWGIGSGGLYNNKKSPSQALKVADRPIGDWNRFHVKMIGEKVTVWLNGELVVDSVVLENYWDRTRPIFSSEQLELQCHGDPVEWRNIFIKEL